MKHDTTAVTNYSNSLFFTMLIIYFSKWMGKANRLSIITFQLQLIFVGIYPFCLILDVNI